MVSLAGNRADTTIIVPYSLNFSRAKIFAVEPDFLILG